jgi:DNA-binding transcriptional LysR family regulator
MRFHKLDLNQLVILDALLSERSVGRAARRLYLSQPATSCALSRLREYFEDDLLVMVGKAQALTPLACELQQPIRDVLLQVQTITRIRPSFDPTTSARHFTLESSDNVMLVFLQEAVRQAALRAPLMEFDLRLLGARSKEHLDSGDMELLICPDFAAVPGHPMEPLYEESFSCAVWTGHPTVRDRLDVAQYFDCGHVGLTWPDGRRVTVDAHVVEIGRHKRRQEVIAPNFALMAEMVLGTSRIATLPTRVALKMAERLPLRVLPCPIELPHFHQVLQWHKFLERDPALAWLRALLLEIGRAMPALAALGGGSVAAPGRRRAAKPAATAAA